VREQIDDLKAMRLAARVSVETMAARLRIAPEMFRDLETGRLLPSGELLDAWQREVGMALFQARRRRMSASRALRRWFMKIS